MDFPAIRYRNDDFDDPRRRFLVRALGMGLYAAAGTVLAPAPVMAMAGEPRQVPPGRSIYRMSGQVKINGVSADEDTRIRPGDIIETGPGSELIFVVGKDAFIVRDNSELELAAPGGGENGSTDRVIDGLRVLTGKLLSVFGERSADESLSLHTPIATIGVRGTGLYLEARGDRDYVCTCYGRTRITAVDDPASTATVSSEQHDSPYFILPEGPSGNRIEAAPVINHTDMELVLVEELVGREPPFDPGSYEKGP